MGRKKFFPCPEAYFDLSEIVWGTKSKLLAPCSLSALVHIAELTVSELWALW